METGRDMPAGVLLWPPKSPYDASLEPMVCRHAHNLPATEEWRSSVDWLEVVWQTKRRLLDTLIHWPLLFRCAEVSIGKQPLRMKGKRAWQQLDRTVSFSGLIAAYPLLAVRRLSPLQQLLEGIFQRFHFCADSLARPSSTLMGIAITNKWVILDSV